jgi:hypothetical protein
MLLPINSGSSSSPAVVRSAETESESLTVRPQGRSVNKTLARARSMLQSSRTTGVFRQLSSSKKLRVTSGPKKMKSKTASSTGSKGKPFEFTLQILGF